MELKDVLTFAQIYTVRKFVSSDALSTHCASFATIFDHSSLKTCLSCLTPNVFDVEYADRAESFELLSICVSNFFSQTNVGQISVVRSADGRPFRMRLPNALLTDQFHFDFLPRTQLCYQNVVVERFWQRDFLTFKAFFLIANRNPFQIARVDVGVLVEFILMFGVVEQNRSFWVFFGAFDVQFEAETVPSVKRFTRLFVGEEARVDCDRDKTHAVRQIFVRNY